MSSYASPTIGDLGSNDEPGIIALFNAVVILNGAALINIATVVNAAVLANAVYETVSTVNES